MSGHSKWSKVKHQKATTDVAKAAAFTRATHGIMIAVREGGGVTDPDANFRLRLAIEKAKMVNMPKENIERAIARAKGEDAGELFSLQYEAFGPSGSAYIIDVVTDNNKRAVSAIKNILEHHDATLAAPGAVAHMFRTKGLIQTEPFTGDGDLIALEAGADDVDGNTFITDPKQIMQVKKRLEEQGIGVQSAEIVMIPVQTIQVSHEDRKKIDTLIRQIEENEDVQNVFTNLQPDE